MKRYRKPREDAAHVDNNANDGALFPQEQDRKTVLGCLAAVLNIMFAHQHQESLGNDSPKLKKSEGDNSNDNNVSQFSIRQDLEDEEDEQQKSTIQQLHHKNHLRRIKEFQRELLHMSAELLFLAPDDAAVFMPNLDIQCDSEDDNHKLLLQPFLQSLTSYEESFRCITLLVFRFLLLSSAQKEGISSDKQRRTIVGYDSRVRFAFKYLAVAIFTFWELHKKENKRELSSSTETHNNSTAAAYATRKFEALEQGNALRLSLLSAILQQEQQNRGTTRKSITTGQKQKKTFGQAAVRGLKIGAAGVTAGTLFAVTGGVAAPAIVGGIAALTGASTLASVAATILLFPAASTIFGVGGGTLVAKKMSKRTTGLEDFEIVKIQDEHETSTNTTRNATDDSSNNQNSSSSSSNNTDLTRTICISGWLRDEHDSERPFGITPTSLQDTHELLCRYCSVYAPDVIPQCRDILKKWEGREEELWDMCRSNYGKDPRTLLPLQNGELDNAMLTLEENTILNDLVVRTLGLPLPIPKEDSTKNQDDPNLSNPPVNLLSDVLVTSKEEETKTKKLMSNAEIRFYQAWDFRSAYGSELYVIKWEKDLLLEVSGSARKFQMGLAKKAAEEALKKTVMATLMAAVAIPATLLSLSDIIDETWTLAAERADEAGIVLAQSLLESDAGHRPVSLIGFSFGARMIVACLKELARHQVIWEKEQQQEGEKQHGEDSTKANSLSKSFLKKNSKQVRAPPYLREPASIVEDVILMGCPASINTSSWDSCRDIVSGRLVNCYSKSDIILALMYRIKNLTKILSPPAGIGKVQNVPGVENYNVTSLVANHGEYCVAVREILQMVGYNQPQQPTPPTQSNYER